MEEKERIIMKKRRRIVRIMRKSKKDGRETKGKNLITGGIRKTKERG